MTTIPATTAAAAKRSLQRYAGALGQDWAQKATDTLLDGIKSILNPVENAAGTMTGDTLATTRADLISDLIRRFDNGAAIADELNLDFKIKTATDVANGGGRFLQAQSDVEEYPAWALSRFYDRDVPRGFQRGKKGVLIPVPDDDWPSRWAEAGAACGDDDWLPWEGSSQSGRGVALKKSGIWQALGDLRDDSLGNPFPPFAFNSGFDVDGVPFKECVQLGLIDEDATPKPASLDLSTLFPEVLE